MKLFAPVKVSGPTQFNLLAVWSFNRRKNPPKVTARALDYYRGFLTEMPSLVAGDFNNNVLWDKSPVEGSSHFAMVSKCVELGMFSAYHHHRNEAQGAEKEPTIYWRNRTKDGPRYHIDYCFLPAIWKDGLQRVELGTYEDWVGAKLSDHVPMIVDVNF